MIYKIDIFLFEFETAFNLIGEESLNGFKI